MATPTLVPQEPQATPAAPVETPAPSAAATPQPAGATPSWELVIDDRTRYASPEDAKRGWQELSTFRQNYQSVAERMKAYGAENPDAFWNNLEYTLQELEKLQKAGQPAAATPSAAPAAPQPVTLEQVQQLLSQQKQEQEWQTTVNASVQYGRSVLKELMASAKLPVADEDLSYVSSLIEQRVVDQSRDAKNNLIPGSPEDRFLKGTDADRKAIVEAEFQKFRRFAQVPAAAASADYAAQKSAAMAAQPKSVPANSSGTPAAKGKRLTESELRQNVLSILSQ